MAKKKQEVQTVSTEALEAAIDEVNEQLDLDPEIEKRTDKGMRKELKDAMEDEELFEGDEEFTSGTYDVFEILGIEHDAVKIKDDDESEEDENIKEGEEEEETVTKRKKGAQAKRATKKENKKGETKMKTKVKTGKKRIKRLVSKKIIAKKKGRIKDKIQGTKKYSRMCSIIDTIEKHYKKGITANEVIERSNDLYNKKTGGNKEVNKSGFMTTATTAALKALAQFDFLKSEGGMYIKK